MDDITGWHISGDRPPSSEQWLVNQRPPPPYIRWHKSPLPLWTQHVALVPSAPALHGCFSDAALTGLSSRSTLTKLPPCSSKNPGKLQVDHTQPTAQPQRGREKTDIKHSLLCSHTAVGGEKAQVLLYQEKHPATFSFIMNLKSI